MQKDEGGKIITSIIEENKMLRIVIEDDGIGMVSSKALKKNARHHSLGLEMVAKRLQVLSEKFHQDFSIISEDRSSEIIQGTRIIFLLPILDMSQIIS